MKQLFILVFCSLLLGSCATRIQRAQKHLSRAISLDPTIIQTTKRDSVIITDSVRIKDSVDVRTKDSTIIIPKTVIIGNVGNPCDTITGKLGTFDYYLGAGANKLHIWSDGNQIHYESTVDSLISTIHSKDTYISSLKDQIKSKEEVKETTNTVKIIQQVAGFRDKVIWTVVGFALGILVVLLFVSGSFAALINAIKRVFKKGQG